MTDLRRAGVPGPGIARQPINEPPAPRVSVVVAFLNAGRYLDEAVSSVVEQTLTDWELLLVDDGSSDESTAVARGWARRRPDQVKYLEHPGHENRGPGASRNLGMREAAGNYVAFLDADDVYLRDRLAAHVSVLDAMPGVDMVQSDHTYWYCWQDRQGRWQQEDCRRPPLFLGDAVIRPPEGLYFLFGVPDAFTASCSVTIRRSAALELGGFDEQFRWLYEDQVFLTKVYAHKVVYSLHGCHARYRMHAGGTLSAAVASVSGIRSRLIESGWRLREWQTSYLDGLLDADCDVRELLAAHARSARSATRTGVNVLMSAGRRTVHEVARRCLPVPAYRRLLQRRQSWSAERARKQHMEMCQRRSACKMVRSDGK